jgi:HPt (histidine-containing phosphotransfer) domain-containing protein
MQHGRAAGAPNTLHSTGYVWGGVSEGGGQSLEDEVVTHLQMLGEAAGEDVVIQLVSMFFQKSAPANVQKLRDALAGRDTEAVAGTAHKLYGSSANLGAKRVASLCREIEALARSGTVDGAAELVEALDASVAQAHELFSEALSVLQASPADQPSTN